MSSGSKLNAAAGAGAKSTRALALRVGLYLLFAASGLAGLIYESLWARYLGLFVGHTAYAQILVLGIFLGGMALGALAVGARSERLRDPLLAYAVIEVGIGGLGLLFHPSFTALTAWCYEVVFPALADPTAIALVKWSVAGLLILPQSLLLGMTFPLMSAGVLRRTAGPPGRTLSLLYFSNSLGAALGVVVSGFLLIGWIGLPATLAVAGVTNLAVAALTAGLAWLRPASAANGVTGQGDGAEDIAPPLDPGAAAIAPHRLAQALLGVAFGTAVASFIYEVGWIRMLSQVLGSASHSFELMLSAFIFGLALGALWVRGRADSWREPVRALGLIQCAMGLAALATLPLYLASFGWMEGLLDTLSKSDSGYRAFGIARYSLCLIIMLPSTFCAGITLPLITRILLARDQGERVIGRVYGFNTLGSIFGAVTAGLVLLPWLGTHTMIVLGAVLDMALGVALLHALSRQSRGSRRWTLSAGAACAAAALLALTAFDFDPRVISSGPFRGRADTLAKVDAWRTEFYEDGRTATVSVIRDEMGHRFLATNGKPDASLPPVWFEACSDTRPLQPLSVDTATQALAPLITLAHHRDPRRGAVIGFGSGMSTHFMLSDDELEVVDTIEIEPAIVRGARVFYPANAAAYDDPRSHLLSADAKTRFASGLAPYDVIFSEPSNPWVSGVANLFTREFYAHVRRSLTSQGVFGQWLHLYEIDDRLVLSILAAIHENFPAYEIFLTASMDMLVVASVAQEMPEPDWGVLARPAVRASLCHHPAFTPEMLEATRVTHRAALAPLLEQGVVANSDFFPALEMGAERARYLGTRARGFLEMHEARHSLSASFLEPQLQTPTDRVPPVPAIPGMWKLALTALLDSSGGDGESWSDPVVDGLRFRYEQWRAVLATGSAPAQWRHWLDEMAVIEESLHGGRRGRADEGFYRGVWQYLDASAAPEDVRDVVQFRHARANWNFPIVSQAGERLVPDVLGGRGLLRAGELLEGLVLAQLRLGDGAGALRTYRTLTRLAPPEKLEKLQYRLLDAHIRAANARGAEPAMPISRTAQLH